ncbi:MAG TPA: acyl dehydratase [Pseudoclavibacter sp.]|nr:acyl dehydratase [Pseudoclavibacter sp.]
MTDPWNVGDTIAAADRLITRETLVRYAGASGDFNPIHYRDDVATAAGLPGVIAHGMLTMGIAVGVLEDALGDPSRIREVGCRFARPVIVDPEHGVLLHVEAQVTSLQQDSAVVALSVTVGGQSVLVKARATVQL